MAEGDDGDDEEDADELRLGVDGAEQRRDHRGQGGPRVDAARDDGLQPRRVVGRRGEVERLHPRPAPTSRAPQSRRAEGAGGEERERGSLGKCLEGLMRMGRRRERVGRAPCDEEAAHADVDGVLGQGGLDGL